MSLFDFFKKPESLEYYLDNLDADDLCYAAKKIFRSKITEYSFLLYFSSEIKKCFSMKARRKIHSHYYKTKVDFPTLFEKAAEKGSAEAMFYMGLLHYHGIYAIKDKSYIGIDYRLRFTYSTKNKNTVKAKEYFEAAEKNGFYMAGVYRKVTEYFLNTTPHMYEEYTSNRAEREAICAFSISPNVNERNKIDPNCNWLYFNEIMTRLIVFYACNGSPYAMYLIAGGLNYYEQTQEKGMYVGEFSNSYSDERKAAGKVVYDNLLEKAEEGDKYAKAVLDTKKRINF